jgi:hypothetical protein
MRRGGCGGLYGQSVVRINAALVAERTALRKVVSRTVGNRLIQECTEICALRDTLQVRLIPRVVCGAVPLVDVRIPAFVPSVSFQRKSEQKLDAGSFTHHTCTNQRLTRQKETT